MHKLRTYYIANGADPSDFLTGEVIEVEATCIEDAAKIDADRLFDEEGVDPSRAVDVIVAEDKAGTGAMLFKVRRIVDIRHEIDSSKPIDIPAADNEEEA